MTSDLGIPQIRIALDPKAKWDEKAQGYKSMDAYRADLLFSDGTNYHTIDDTPAKALMRLAHYWLVKTDQ